ncbi:hypothetical protein M378DRAFT_315476 [Amanita muscaria Koide BX008]|uniref:Uncharacterized protein n=1 Tax=Amanita muscaria (strain Koide BX008) TaxID=946122 RepID=A0A0C2WPC1_AMAMK|nr:hypothetical protein M378DRAFT_315476 [Amanita muscaria Koide BX008]
MSLKSLILQSLFVLLFCTSFLSATDRFGVERSKWNGVEAYIGSLEYPDSTVITRHFLVQEAKAFWKSLPPTGGPGMVSALYAGNRKIYFATSITGTPRDGNNQNLGFPRLITDILDVCRRGQDGLDGTHVFHERCAELMVITEWHLKNPNSHLAEGKLIVAVDHNLAVRRPCSWEDHHDQPQFGKTPFGCDDVLHQLGFTSDQIVETDPGPELACPMRRRGFGGLIERGCVPKKSTAKHSPSGKPAPKKPAPKKPTAQGPRQGKPKPPSNNRSKSTPPKMPAKSMKAPSNRGPKQRLPAKSKAPSNRGPKRRLPAKPKAPSNKGPKH